MALTRKTLVTQQIRQKIVLYKNAESDKRKQALKYDIKALY